MEPWVDFNSRDMAGGFAQYLGQNTATGTYFEDLIVQGNFRQRDDFAHDVGIDEKILTEPFDRGRRIGGRILASHVSRTGRGAWGCRQLLGQRRQRRAIAVDQIGKLFDQIIGK